MHTLTSKRVSKFARDFGFSGSESDQFERYVAASYLFHYIGDRVDLIESSVIGGGSDEGIDIAAVIVNGKAVSEPSEIDEVIADQRVNSAKVIFIQAKTSEKYDTKLIAKFLHGVESVTKYAMRPKSVALPPRLVDIASLIERIAENGDKFLENRIPCELYYVTTSSHDGASAASELQVTEAVERIRDIGTYTDNFRLRLHGQEELSTKQKERHGPRNVQFMFEKRQTIPATERVSEAYIGLISASELLKLLLDDSGEIRAGIFEDNVRLDLGAQNPVNQRILGTLQSADREHFAFLNNGLTVVATELRGSGDRFFISNYQVVNGGQTSHQLIRWAKSIEGEQNAALLRDVWIPVKIVSSTDANMRTGVSIATNLQTAIDASDIQGNSQAAKNVEEFFERSGPDGLRYERQKRGSALEFPKTRVVTTPELNRAVAATLFGESSRAIGQSNELQASGSYVWGGYPEEAYYYAAWIIYRLERYFARTPDLTRLKAAKYHMAMMVSARINREFIALFQRNDVESVKRRLLRPKGLNFRTSSANQADPIEDGIACVMKLTENYFEDVLKVEGRSLRKDDVRSRKTQESLLNLVLNESPVS